MTTINAKYSIGDKAFTVDKSTLRIVEFEIGRISATVSADETDVYLYPVKEDGSINYKGYNEQDCFESRGFLMAHLDGNDENTINL